MEPGVVYFPRSMKKKNVRLAGIVILLFVTGIASVVGFWKPGILLGTPNDGHQLGGDLFDDIPGNTIESFSKAIENLEQSDTYLYSEFDVRETSDGELVVFHDWDVSAIPDTPQNRDVLGGKPGSQAICDLTLNQIQSLELKGGYRIPALDEILTAAKELNLTKPLLVEIKYLKTDQARQKLFESVKQCRDESGLEIHFLAFVRNIKRSYPEPQAWLQKFSESGFRVYQVFRNKEKTNDLCRTW